MRKAPTVLAVLLATALAWFGVQVIASESGEVVVVRTTDAAGETHETRLWVVDHDGAAWLRAGHAESGWLKRMQAQPEIEVVREGRTLALRATAVPEARDVINTLMHEKYGWADAYISFFFSRERKVPVRLDPR